MITYSNSVLRTVALHTQCLNSIPSQGSPTDNIFEIIKRLGCIQIDTLHVVNRSHYLALWSRIGNYDKSKLDLLASDSDRRIFEGWQHAASLIPIEEYRYQLPRQRHVDGNPDNWYARSLNETGQDKIVAFILERIKLEGALKVSDFKSDGHSGGSWWNWRPAKIALEFLNASGKLVVTKRENFQRVYDIPERVLPTSIDLSEPTIEERDRFWVEKGAKALGVFLPRHAGDYTWMKVRDSRSIVEDFLRQGTFVKIIGKTANNETTEYLIHRDNLVFLEQAADGTIISDRTTFLSPFDNLWWANRRDEQLWGFHQSLEAYLPASKRVYGYFCLPILHKGNLIGRFDPKLERNNATLRLKSIYLESGVIPTAEIISNISICMRDFMSFHDAKDLIIEQSNPSDFGQEILKVL